MAFDRAHVHVLREELVIVAPFFLGVVHRGIGILDQRFRILGVGRVHADADAGRHMQLVFANRMWHRQRSQYLVGGQGSVFHMLVRRYQDYEFVATLPAHRIGTAHAVRQAPRNRLQQLVAGRMSERIVDVLEIVQIQKQHRERRSAPFRQSDGLRDAIVQQEPVRQAGQEIVLRQVAHFHGRCLRGRDVMEHHHRTGDLAV